MNAVNHRVYTVGAIVLICAIVCGSVPGTDFHFESPQHQPSANKPTFRLPSPDDGCGQYVQPTRVKTPIIARTEQGFMPSVVQLSYASEGGKMESICTGTLITSLHVLTAASCITPSLRSVRLGQIDRRIFNNGQIDRSIASTTIHPQYTESTATAVSLHNVAVIRLDREVDYTLDIRPVCLPWLQPWQSKNYTHYNPFVVGWSTTRPDTQPDVDFHLFDRQHTVQQSCLKIDHDKEQYHPTPGLICVENWAHDFGPCIEDGSPLMQPEKVTLSGGGQEFRMFQTGIGSFGLDCDFDDALRLPLGYTSVQDYVHWIWMSL